MGFVITPRGRDAKTGLQRYLCVLHYTGRTGTDTTVRRTVLGYSNVEPARKALTQLAEQRSGRPLDASSLTVGRYGEAHRKYETLKPAHVLTNNASYRHRLLRRFGRMPMDGRLDQEWVRFVADMRASGLTQHTVNKYAAVMRAILRLWFGPDAPLPIRAWGSHSVKPREETLTDAEQYRLIETAERRAPHLAPILTYALAVPSRRGELVRARAKTVDVFNGVFWVPVGDSKAGVGIWKPIPPHMLEYFRTLPEDTEYVFYRRDRDGVCRPLGDFKRALHGVLRSTGLLGRFRFHDTRHHAATNLVNNGTPERVIMDMAGWSTNMLATYYKRRDRQSTQLIKWGPEPPQTTATSQQLFEGQG